MGEKKITILGLDPGTRITGYGVIISDGRTHSLIDCGAIRPPPKLPLYERYEALYEGVVHLLALHPVEALSIENQFVSHNAQSALKLGMAKGVALLAATQKKIPLFEYAPRTAKRAVVGSGSASKEQVKRMIQRIFSLEKPPSPEDAADALALALTHAHHLTSPLAHV